MQYTDIDQLISQNPDAIAKAPIALVFAEDPVEIDTTVRHNLHLGFKSVILFMPSEFELAHDVAETVQRVDCDFSRDGNRESIVKTIIAKAPGVWIYVCYNAEYLFFPFCETRTIGELLAFHTEERRDAMLTYVIDLYARDLVAFPSAVSLDKAFLDKSGYYALARPDPDNHNHPRERQLDFFGGLRWRFEEHIPENRRKIDRISIFRAKAGLHLRADFTFDDEEYNTYACPWHNNLTAAVCSFRTAKALKANPGSTHDIHDFKWHNSVPFEWHSRQLLDLGLMEPGQWF